MQTKSQDRVIAGKPREEKRPIVIKAAERVIAWRDKNWSFSVMRVVVHGMNDGCQSGDSECKLCFRNTCQYFVKREIQ